jgi:hypothetical protein
LGQTPRARHHTLQMMHALRDTGRVSMLQELHGCKRSHTCTKPLRCVFGNFPGGNRITGSLLAVERSSGALIPFRDTLGSHARCMGRKLQNRVHVSRVDGASWTQLYHHSTPACMRTSTPLAYNHHVPCPTQRTHATWLYGWRQPWPFSAKDLL